LGLIGDRPVYGLVGSFLLVLRLGLGFGLDLGEKGVKLTPISASSLTDSKIVTSWSGFAIFVDMPADRPARPAPMIIR
jgi:hypothetical protein